MYRDLIYLVINGNRETNQHMFPMESFTLRFQTADGELVRASIMRAVSAAVKLRQDLVPTALSPMELLVI